jgi:hypothetical protein
MDEADALEDEAEDLEEEKSGSESSDGDESEGEFDDLEGFRQSNVDCASGDVIFIDDSGEGDESPAATCAANTSEDMAQGDYNEIEVREVIKEADCVDLQILQLPLPSFEPAPSPNAPDIQGGGDENLGVDIESTPSPSVQPVSNEEVSIPTEGRGNRKRRAKHPTRLYECDCGEVISGGEIERGEGLIECKKAGCETRWVSPRFQFWELAVTHHSWDSFI